MKAFLPVALLAALLATPANATTYTLDLTGNVGNATNSTFTFSGLNFNAYYLNLDGFGSPITVQQGDIIDSTVNLSQTVTIPGTQVRTDLLQYLTGPSFPSENTGVTGTFSFYNAGNLVASFNYTSTSADQLSAFAAVFPPSNTALTFSSFTNDLTIQTLATPATLTGSSVQVDLVSSAAPEPSSWMLMIAGFAITGGVMRRRGQTTKLVATCA